jgi:ABC-2 type transport system permease protein
VNATTAVPAVAARRGSSHGRVTIGRVLWSEWVKLWSLRSTRWSFLAGVICMALVGVIAAAIQMGRWSHLSLHERLTIKPIDLSLTGFDFAQLAIGVLGVLIISGEYTTGMISSSVMAVPKRLPILWSKIGVFASVTFVLMLAASLIAFFGSQAFLGSHGLNVGLGSPDALRAIVGNALFLTVLGILCVAIGTLVRNSAGGISTFVGVMFILPVIFEILPASIGNAVHPYLPSSAGEAVAQAVPGEHMLAPWTGFALFVGYTAVAVAAAALTLKRRDV